MYKLVECPGCTAIADAETGEWLVTIVTKRSSTTQHSKDWEFLTPKELEERKAQVLAIFNHQVE